MMLLTALLACDSAPEAPPVVDDPCPEISLDGLAGDWGKVSGSQFDHKVRTRIFKEGDAWQAWYVAGGFRKVAMKGEMRAEDLVLTEDRELGADPVLRLYFQPHKPKCAMRVVEVRVTSTEGKEKETQVGAGYIEFVAMPEEPAFTYQPCVADAVVATVERVGQGDRDGLGVMLASLRSGLLGCDPPWPPAQFDALLRTQVESGLPAVPHSSAYVEAYDPHYRVVLLETLG